MPEDHFGWFVLDAVDALDLEPFYVAYRRDGRARPAYEPAMMAALIMYAYARGVGSCGRSSGRASRMCETHEFVDKHHDRGASSSRQPVG